MRGGSTVSRSVGSITVQTLKGVLRAVQRQLRAQPYDVVVAGDPLSVLAARHAGVDDLKIVCIARAALSRAHRLWSASTGARRRRQNRPADGGGDALITSGLRRPGWRSFHRISSCVR